jgi:hypothetical protein
VTGFGDDVYQPDPTDQVDLDQLDDSDTLTVDGIGDPLDEGYSPLDRPIGLRGPETFAERLADELPDIPTGTRAIDGDGLGDSTDSDGELRDDQVGFRRSGRLVAPDEGAHADRTADLVARDVGIDGAAASAEEAAVHVIGEDADEREVAVERDEATAAEA